MLAPGWCFPGAPQPKVLILASSVVGTPSLEESAVRALHPTWQVDVVSDDQWKALSAADFASYQAIILGDPDCDTFECERQKTCIAGRVFVVHLSTARSPLLLPLPDEFSLTNHHATITKVAWSVPRSVWLCRSVHQLNMGPAAHWQRDRRGHGAGLPLWARAAGRTETDTEWHQLRHRLDRQPDRRLHLLVVHRGAGTSVVVSFQVSAWQRLDTTPHMILNRTPAQMIPRSTPCSCVGESTVTANSVLMQHCPYTRNDSTTACSVIGFSTHSAIIPGLASVRPAQQLSLSVSCRVE
jgi:hypothetical protein